MNDEMILDTTHMRYAEGTRNEGEHLRVAPAVELQRHSVSRSTSEADDRCLLEQQAYL